MLSSVLSRGANWASNLIICLTLIAAPAWVAYDFMRTQNRPRIVKQIWIEPISIPVSGSFTVHIRAAIAKKCVTQVHRWIIRAIDNSPVWMAIEPGRPTAISDESIISVELRLDPKIEPGDYYYKSIVYDTCPGIRGDETFTTSPPFVYFKVIRPPQSQTR